MSKFEKIIVRAENYGKATIILGNESNTRKFYSNLISYEEGT